MSQLGLAFAAQGPSVARAAVRAGYYLCTYCWTDNGLSDSVEHFYCRTCGRRDRLALKRPHEVSGFDLRCPSPPLGWLRCPDDVAAACRVCGVYKAFVDGKEALRKDEEAGRRERQDATLYVEILREDIRDHGRCFAHDRTTSGAVVRLWDENGYQGGWARIADFEGLFWDAVRLELRRCPLTYAQVLAGQLAPEPEL
jgi:hypothetical protein